MGHTGAVRESEAGALDEQVRFREVVSEHLRGLYSLARRLAGDDAEDALQGCLLKAYRSLPQLQDRAAARAGPAAILVNCCRDRARAGTSRPEEVDLDVDELDRFSLFRKIADEDPFPYSDTLHLDFLEQFGSDDVRRILLSLPDIYRVPLVLVHMEGFSTKEVAAMVGAPLGTVLARLHRGRKLFQKRMWDYAQAHGLVREGVR